MEISPRDAHWLLTEKYLGVKSPHYFADLERLRKGEPIAYVIGWIPFLRARIKLEQRPLIPRPETEYWADEAFRMLARERTHIANLSFADCYAGSGCIGIAALLHFPKARCTFIDIGGEECAQIEENIRSNITHKERASVLQGDVCATLVGPYDALFANPPYIDPHATDVDESVKVWEPYRALYADEHGLLEIKKLLACAHGHLASGGSLFCEFGKGQESAIAALPEASSWRIEFHPDQYGVTRWFRAFPNT
ncbi:MAG TPA: HemK family protein methyltransferase [Candidatus Paceibacterota bacterium]|nr:HemK family protein methyltransferase [Candidatus Paceibacterota bacterium]